MGFVCIIFAFRAISRYKCVKSHIVDSCYAQTRISTAIQNLTNLKPAGIIPPRSPQAVRSLELATQRCLRNVNPAGR